MATTALSGSTCCKLTNKYKALFPRTETERKYLRNRLLTDPETEHDKNALQLTPFPNTPCNRDKNKIKGRGFLCRRITK